MATVSPTQVSPGDEISAASVNTPINQLAAQINGNLDDTNISGISGSKLAAGTVPESAMATPRGFKVGTFTVTGTGPKSVTGLGFQPSSIIFMPMLTDSTSQGLFGLGFWDGTSSVSMNMGARITATSGNFTQEATGTVFRASDFSSGAENVKAQATGTSLDSDGFTVNVVAASGTQVIAYIAFG